MAKVLFSFLFLLISSSILAQSRTLEIQYARLNYPSYFSRQDGEVDRQLSLDVFFSKKMKGKGRWHIQAGILQTQDVVIRGQTVRTASPTINLLEIRRTNISNAYFLGPGFALKTPSFKKIYLEVKGSFCLAYHQPRIEQTLDYQFAYGGRAISNDIYEIEDHFMWIAPLESNLRVQLNHRIACFLGVGFISSTTNPKQGQLEKQQVYEVDIEDFPTEVQFQIYHERQDAGRIGAYGFYKAQFGLAYTLGKTDAN